MSINEQKHSRSRNEMAQNERQNKILVILKEKKSANVKELSSLLFVSEATVRRDLCEMQKLGLI